MAHEFWDNNPTALQVLQRISQRWAEMQAHKTTMYDFDCLMSDVDNYIHQVKGDTRDAG